MKIEVGKTYTCMSYNLRVERGHRVIIERVSEEDDIVEFKVLSNGQRFGFGLGMFDPYFMETVIEDNTNTQEEL